MFIGTKEPGGTKEQGGNVELKIPTSVPENYQLKTSQYSQKQKYKMKMASQRCWMLDNGRQ